MRKIIIMLLLLMGVVNIVHSQIITVTNIETGSPLDLVSLTSKSTRVFKITNAQGQADISQFVDSDKIELRSLGYKTRYFTYAEIEQLNFRVQLEPSNINLDQVVISATRWEQESEDIPVKISVISSKDVALRNPQTAADLLNLSGKVYVQKSQQGGGSPMIRGFSTNRLLYTIDGVRMNTAIFRSGNLQNVISLDPFAIENTEVLFGPGTVIYGSDAIGGVMSFSTLKPQLSLTDKPLVTGKAVTRYSSANNEKTGHFDVNVGWKKWAMVTSISSWDFDHLRQGSKGPDDYVKPIHVQRQDSTDVVVTQEDPLLQIPSAYSQINMMQKVRFKPNENWDLEYGFHYSETSPYGRYDRNTRYRNGTLRYAEWDYGPQKWMMNNLSIKHKANNAVFDEVSLILAFQKFEESRIDRSLNNKNRTINGEEVDAYSVNLDFTKLLSPTNKLFYGFEYIMNDVVSTGSLTDITTGGISPAGARYPNSTWSSMAAYVNNELQVSEKLTAVAGLRYNQFVLDSDFSNILDFYPFPFTKAKIDNGSLTGSIGAVYRPSSSWVISGNFGTAFRSPNVDDIGKIFDSQPGGVTVPNPGLKAEYAYNFDLGIAKVIGDVVKIDVTGYYTMLDNALVLRDFQLGGLDSIMYDGELSSIQAVQNAAVANVYGIQAGLEIKLPAGFSISSDLNYQVGEEEIDDGTKSPSRHAPPLFGVSRLKYNANKLRLQFYVEYMSERKHDDLPFEEKGKIEVYALDADGNTYAPSWYTLNLKASYDLSDTFTISSGIENLQDTRYRPYSSGISAPGRNFILSLRANF